MNLYIKIKIDNSIRKWIKYFKRKKYMKTVEDYFKYLKNELSLIESPFSKSILEKVEKYEGDDLSNISKMLFFLYKVESIRVANYKEW